MSKSFELNRDLEYPEWILFTVLYNSSTEVIRGTTQKCLKHFGRMLAESDDDTHRIKVIREWAEFVGVCELTVREWFNPNSQRMPGRENLLRVQCLLKLRGYKITEIENRSLSFQMVSFLIARRKITLKQVADAIGIKKPGRLLGYLTGRLQLKSSDAKEQLNVLRMVFQLRRFLAEVYLQDEMRHLQLLADVNGTLELELHDAYTGIKGKVDDDFLEE